MPTGDKKVNIYNKRLLSRTAMKVEFLDFLSDENDAIVNAMFVGASGTLDSDKIGLSSTGNDVFSIDTSAAQKVVVSGGQIIDLTGITGTGITDDIPFKNTAATPYYVGVKFAEVEDGLELNPRTGDPEYPRLKQSFGRVDTPDSLVDTPGVKLRINVDSITEAGVDHSGRSCKVWLVDPVGLTEVSAFATETVQYDGANYIEVTYSGADGPLGQDTGSAPPSTTALDYKVFIEGVSWLEADIRADKTYAFIGIITGNGPAATPVAFDLADQLPALLISLDRAYDGILGSGSGREVFLDAGAITITCAGGSGDTHRAALRVDRAGDTENSGICAELIADEDRGASVAGLEPLAVAGSLLAVEDVTQAGADLLNFVGGAAALQTALVNPLTDIVWIKDIAGYSRLYLIDAVNSQTQLQLLNLDGSAIAAWDTLSGTASILRPQLWAAGPNFAHSALGGDADGLKGVCMARTPVSIFPYGNQGLRLYNSAVPSVLRTFFSSTALMNAYGATFTPEGKAGDYVILNPVPGGLGSRIGVMLHAKGINDAQDSGRVIEGCGRIGTPHRHYDDFNYLPTGWTTSLPGPAMPASLALKYTLATFGATSDILMMPQGGNNEFFHGGVLALRVEALAGGEYAEINTPDGIWYPKTAFCMLFFRYAFDADKTNRVEHLMLRSGSTTHQVGFEYDDSLSAGWRGFIIDGAGAKTYTASLGTPAASTFYNFIVVITDEAASFHTSMAPSTAPVALPLWAGGLTGLAANISFYQQARSYNTGAPGGTKDSYLDYWEMEDDHIHYSGY
jgi:hypothetical protein